MRKRPLGNTGPMVSELALGTWGLSGDGYTAVPEAEQDRVIDRACALGITLFETADQYAGGAMEQRLGRRLSDPGRTRIATKIGSDRDASPPRKRFDAQFLREAFERSRERLRRDTVDVVLLHNPSLAAVERGEAVGVMTELAEKKAVGCWGVSAAGWEIARAALARGAKVVSLAHNAFHSKDLRMLADDIRQHGAGVLAHSVLAYGLLCGHWAPDKEFPGGDHRSERWTSDEFRRRLRQLDALRPVVGGAVLTLRAGALRYVLSTPAVSSAVIGPRNTLQLDQLVREAGKEPPYLSDQQLTALAARLRDAGVES
jgi:aryl-alcohol dehydrogenase-like predicted oxidoreductase